MTNEELVRHAYNCGVAWALKSETALTVDQFIEANLTPVQSGGMATNWKLPIGNVCFNCGRELNVHSSTGQYCPNDGKSTAMWKNTRFVPIPVPTPQAEARGVDLSGLVHWCINKLFDADLPEFAKEAQHYLAHLQQAPQGEKP